MKQNVCFNEMNSDSRTCRYLCNWISAVLFAGNSANSQPIPNLQLINGHKISNSTCLNFTTLSNCPFIRIYFLHFNRLDSNCSISVIKMTHKINSDFFLISQLRFYTKLKTTIMRKTNKFIFFIFHILTTTWW